MFPIHGHGLRNSNFGHAIVYNNQVPIVMEYGGSKELKNHLAPVYFIGAMGLGSHHNLVHGTASQIPKPLIKHKGHVVQHTGGQKHLIHNVGQIVSPIIHKSVPSNMVQTIIVPNNGITHLSQDSHSTSTNFGHNIVHSDQVSMTLFKIISEQIFWVH